MHAGAFALAALILSLLLALGVPGIAALMGASVPASFQVGLGVAGPAIAALLFAARRCEDGWVSPVLRLAEGLPSPTVLLFPPIFALAAVAGAALSGGSFEIAAPTVFVSGFLVQLLVVALLEEIGWRGYLTPVLLERMTPFATGIVVGVAWWFWHLPKFGIDPLFTAMLLVACIANSIVMTGLLRQRGGLLACIILHGSFNLTQAVFDLQKTSLSAQLGAYAAATAVATVWAALCYQKTMRLEQPGMSI